MNWSRMCEDAAGGSLFLDEISAMPEATQYAALELVEQGVGARILAGTTADLAHLSSEGRFHADLFYRLDVMRVRIPSLAERPEDIPVIFRHYVAQAAEQAGIAEPEISSEHLAALMASDWPGNARSLMSAAMRFVLGHAGRGVAGRRSGVERTDGAGRTFIADCGAGAAQRQSGIDAAKALKLPRKTFYDKLARYRIRPEDYRR